jgi:hypothetical protein
VRTRALLAEEREPNVYSGFWTSHDSIVERVLDRLSTVSPENDPL